MPASGEVDWNERYERLAAEFQRDTRMLAPGKDQAAAEGGCPSSEERTRRWREWLRDRETNTACAFCEYFDGGGLRNVERARQTGEVLHGDCLNNKSPRFETTSDDTCDHFFRDTGGAEA